MSESSVPHSPNRLIHETSPYLLQHAYNPVDWYPWNEEALQRAIRENKPILLSIGYSACHWCHVMERESFENDQIAAIMNAHFVCIKVDREERPDLDDIYMQATLAMNQGNGGWPMTVFLTPNQEPIFAGTYFPPTDRWGRPGFATVLQKIAEGWSKDQEDIVRTAERFYDETSSSNEGFVIHGSRTSGARVGRGTVFGGFRFSLWGVWTSPKVSRGYRVVVLASSISSNRTRCHSSDGHENS